MNVTERGGYLAPEVWRAKAEFTPWLGTGLRLDEARPDASAIGDETPGWSPQAVSKVRFSSGQIEGFNYRTEKVHRTHRPVPRKRAIAEDRHAHVLPA